MVCVSQADAKTFCSWLTKKTGRTVKLPTEAQWEYAARAGMNTDYLWGNDPDDGKGWCNASDESLKSLMKTSFPERAKNGGLFFRWDDSYAFTSPVGKFKCNNFGLSDMQGNAYPWCEDRWDLLFYSKSPTEDPMCPYKEGQPCVYRGGSFLHGPQECGLVMRSGNLRNNGGCASEAVKKSA